MLNANRTRRRVLAVGKKLKSRAAAATQRSTNGRWWESRLRAEGAAAAYSAAADLIDQLLELIE